VQGDDGSDRQDAEDGDGLDSFSGWWTGMRTVLFLHQRARHFFTNFAKN
jgi:hypothetical protein